MFFFIFFNFIYKIKSTNVNLPNGSSVIVNYAGNIFFSPSVYLTNVLYSPTFKLNLISVSKLCDSISCFLNFSSDSCTIQDLNTRRRIGLGEKTNGLYKLVVNAYASSHPSPHNKISSTLCSISCTSVSNNKTFNVIPSSAIWHFRLGLLFNQRLSQMHNLYPYITCDNKATCEICHFAKHKKLYFTTSVSHATSKFELLHLDIWGPLVVSSVLNH